MTSLQFLRNETRTSIRKTTSKFACGDTVITSVCVIRKKLIETMIVTAQITISWYQGTIN